MAGSIDTGRIAKQLAAIASLHELCESEGIDYWMFGGWAVDFHAGAISRAHDDVDIALWLADHQRLTELLAADGWVHTPSEHEDGYTSYERLDVRLETAFLARAKDGRVFTPTRSGNAAWPDGTFDGCILELHEARARVVAFEALRAEKGELRDDPVVAAKDRADLATLSALRR